jgi:hypothetical protein
VTVNGDHASAQGDTTAANQPPSHDTVALVEEGGEWKIGSLVGARAARVRASARRLRRRAARAMSAHAPAPRPSVRFLWAGSGGQRKAPRSVTSKSVRAIGPTHGDDTPAST